MAQKLRKMVGVLDRKSVYYLSMAAVFVIEFLCLGEKGYLIREDSPAYLTFTGRVGIMPLYPLFLYVNRRLLGEGIYLNAVFVEQTILAGLCILAFTEFIRRRFRLSYIASCPVYLFAMFMPFTVNYPESISNHDILTEGLAFPLFYFYMICFLKSIFDKRYRDIVLLVLVSVLVALTRTQLQLIVALNAAAFFYVAWMKGRHFHWTKQIGRGILCVFAAILIMIGGEVLILGANSVGQRLVAVASRHDVASEGTSVMESSPGELPTAEALPEETPAIENSSQEIPAPSEGSAGDEAAADAPAADSAAAGTAASTLSNVTAQYGHLLVDKAFYEIEADDYLLFGEEDLQKLCRAVYEVADSEKSRYVYARKGLWMWEDIMNGIGNGGRIAEKAWASYLEENPHTSLTQDSINQIAVRLAIAHLGRILYHTLCMMPHGFLCTVFFRKDSIYLFCYLVTLFIYLSALALVIWGYRKKEIPTRYPEFLLGCIVVNALFVAIITIMFFAMQRYLVYCFGIFYVAYYLMAVKFIQHLFYGKRRVTAYEITGKREKTLLSD